MVFSSAQFLFFFLPFALLLTNLAPRGARNAVLLVVSLLFYAWGDATNLYLLTALMVANWGAGLLISGQGGRASRLSALSAAVAFDLAALGWFKYAGFVSANVAALGLPSFDAAGVALPLGISFYVFHSISYVVDVYRRVAPARRNPLDFGLYIAFFPQLIAGPIIRYHDVAAFLDERRVTLGGFALGIERFISGLAKKMLLANPLGLTADAIFAIPADTLSAGTAWLGLTCYTLQIYFDFSGYSDMAIGLARMFGFEFLENFNYPYVSASVQEFWRRWHISLSNWFREYLYVPLGGNRHGAARTCANLLTVFILCGFWHGANWTFLIWGLAHGALLAFERAGFGRTLRRAPRAVAHAYTLLVVALAWVLFRSNTLGDALHYFRALAGLAGTTTDALPVAYYLDRQTVAALIFGAVAATPACTWIARDWRARAHQVMGVVDRTKLQPVETGIVMGGRMVLLLLLMSLSLLQVAGQVYNPFIYFRF